MNPYDPSSSQSRASVARRPVRRLWFVAGLACTLAAAVAVPAVVLLNQEWQFIPTNTYTTGIEINGNPISPKAAITYSGLMAALVLGFAGLVALLAIRNGRINSSCQARAQICEMDRGIAGDCKRGTERD